MRACKECKYWTRNEANKWSPNAEHFGLCRHGAFHYDDGYEYKDTDGLYYWDCEGFSAGFSTGEDFACIHGQYDETH